MKRELLPIAIGAAKVLALFFIAGLSAGLFLSGCKLALKIVP